MKRILIIASIISVTQVQAQKKTLHYPNGNRSFEGEYRMGYSPTDLRDLYNFDTAADKRRLSQVNMGFRTMEREAPILRIFNGKCVFYYENGKESYSGEYWNGIKTGLFTYSFINGAKEAEYTFINGMADGKWKAWYPNGKPRLEENYIALTDAELDTIYNQKSFGVSHLMGNSVLKDRGNLRTFAVDSLRKSPGNTFSKFTAQENSFYKNAHWNGDFVSYYDNGSKCIKMHYKNDARIGKWTFWNEDGKVNVELTYIDNKITSIVNNLPADSRGLPPGMPVPRPQPGMPTLPQQHDAMSRAGIVDSMKAKMAQRPQMARPDQMPVASVETNSYIKEHLVFPDAAKTAKISGMVLLKFIVNEDGTTSDFEIMRGLGSGCDEEAIRVVKSMPNWKPGKKDGQPVKAQTMLPVQFRPDVKK